VYLNAKPFPRLAKIRQGCSADRGVPGRRPGRKKDRKKEKEKERKKKSYIKS
jgi:hypothetical protein